MSSLRSFALSFSLVAAQVCMSPSAAQEMDSVFASYAEYSAFVDRHIMRRDFVPLVLRLGGRDEYREDDLHALNNQLLATFPVNFFEVSVFRETDLGGGFRQEARAYWTGVSYAWFYALLHDRDSELVVAMFVLHSDPAQIMAEF
ncbi:MAG: hypothetical protein ACLFTP_00250 [Rhodosalinus sp.]